MANPLPNEQELYEKIKSENIDVHPLIWDTMYHYLGDYISAITFLAFIYAEKNEPMPVIEAKKIIDYTRKIIDVVGKILHPEKIVNDGRSLEQIRQENMQLHPIIHEFFTHYIPNDINCINFRVSYFLDPMDEQPVPIEEVKKILDCTASMRNFLDRLREATNKNKGYREGESK